MTDESRKQDAEPTQRFDRSDGLHFLYKHIRRSVLKEMHMDLIVELEEAVMEACQWGYEQRQRSVQTQRECSLMAESDSAKSVNARVVSWQCSCKYQTMVVDRAAYKELEAERARLKEKLEIAITALKSVKSEELGAPYEFCCDSMQSEASEALAAIEGVK